MKINDNGGGRQNGLVDFGTTFCLKEAYKRKVQRYIVTKKVRNIFRTIVRTMLVYNHIYRYRRLDRSIVAHVLILSILNNFYQFDNDNCGPRAISLSERSLALVS